MEQSIAKYYKELADLKGDAKFESLAVLQFGQERLREFSYAHPILTKLAQSALPLVEMTSTMKWLKSLRETHEAITRYLKDLLELSKGIYSLPAEGWYFSLEFIDVLAISNLDEYLQNNPAGFEKDVVDTFDIQMLSLEKKLTAAFPTRAHLIKTIFSLHFKGTYEGAIPMALAQTDGISKELFSVKGKNGQTIPVGFFDLTRSKSEIRAQKLALSFEVPEGSVFSILYNQLAKIDRNDSLVLEEKTARLSDLNRHSILHGESIDYGTKINSIKAILLLDFIEDLRMMDNILKEKLERGASKSEA